MWRSVESSNAMATNPIHPEWIFSHEAGNDEVDVSPLQRNDCLHQGQRGLKLQV